MTTNATTRTSTRARMGTSRLGGVPTTLPPATDLPAAAQLDLLIARPARSTPLPGVVHLADWLTPQLQRDLVAAFREWAVPPAGLRHPRVPAGHVMTVQSVCLGWHWSPYAYSRTADDTDGAPVKPLPTEVADLARAAVSDTFGPSAGETYEPDAAIVNLYAPGARLGLHQDGEEPSAAPVVTISLGDTCVFRMAGVDRRTSPFLDIELRSATCSCSAVPAGGSTTACRRCSTAPGRPTSACRPAG